jgi:DNA adenine methylase
VTATTSTCTKAARPFLKWAGGKRQLSAQLQELLPPEIGGYFEPFLGGGALFFELSPERALLADVNRELVDCYRAVRDQVDEVIRALEQHRYEKDHYYRVREWEPASLALPERAARTIFLNKTAFNGLYRVNRSGKFNVPFGRYTRPMICDRENLLACSAALEHTALEVQDFELSTSTSKAGDLIYFDPPYVPISGTADFTRYVAGGFGTGEQERLARVFRALAERGVNVMLSNSDCEAVRDLYAGFPIDVVSATRRINSAIDRRGVVGEIVVRSYALPADRARASGTR